MSANRVTVQVVADEAGKLPPFAVYQPVDPWVFRGFDPSQDVSRYEVFDRAAAGQRPDYALIGRADGYQRDTTLSDQPEGFAYVGGRPATSEYHGQPHSSLAVGVFNRKTRTLQLMPVAGGRVHRLEVRMDNVDYKTTALGAELDPLTFQEGLLKRRQLVDSFGSTRRMRQMQAVSDGRVTGTTVEAEATKAQRTNNAAGLIDQSRNSTLFDGLSREQLTQITASARPLPPHHLDATSPGEAYRLEEMVPQGAWDALDPSYLLEAAEDRQVAEALRKRRHIPDYVASRLTLLRTSDEAIATHKARALDFLVALIHMYQAPHRLVDKTPDKVSQFLRIRRGVLDPLLAMFYISGGSGGEGPDTFERDDVRKEKLGMYIVAVAMVIENGVMHQSQFEGLRSALKRAAPDTLTRFRELGCSVTPANCEVTGEDGKVTTVRSYSLSLLTGKDAQAGKTLAEVLPAVKLVRAQPKRR